MALMTVGECRMRCSTSPLTSFSQSVFSKLKHRIDYCKISPFNVCVFEKIEGETNHFTVTHLARFLGMSGLYPFCTAT